MMGKILAIIVLAIQTICIVMADEKVTAEILMEKMDFNLNSKSRILTSKMIVHGRRSSRTIESKNWVKGTDYAFTEYLSPAREAGTKMLKIEDKLWTYSPQTDRLIQISGHMLRQSVMGSDMSYNDMMEDRPIKAIYKGTIEKVEIIDNRKHYVLLLEALVEGLPYPKRRAWVDIEYLLPIKAPFSSFSSSLHYSVHPE